MRIAVEKIFISVSSNIKALRSQKYRLDTQRVSCIISLRIKTLYTVAMVKSSIARSDNGKTQMLGKKGECLAAHFLQSQGYGILENNVRFQRWELDLIAEKNRELIFVEVKTRRGTRFGYGEEAVSRKKQKNALSVGFDYLKKHSSSKFTKWRFDIIAIDIDSDGSVKEVRHMKDVY